MQGRMITSVALVGVLALGACSKSTPAPSTSVGASENEAASQAAASDSDPIIGTWVNGPSGGDCPITMVVSNDGSAIVGLPGGEPKCVSADGRATTTMGTFTLTWKRVGDQYEVIGSQGSPAPVVITGDTLTFKLDPGAAGEWKFTRSP